MMFDSLISLQILRSNLCMVALLLLAPLFLIAEETEAPKAEEIANLASEEESSLPKYEKIYLKNGSAFKGVLNEEESKIMLYSSKGRQMGSVSIKLDEIVKREELEENPLTNAAANSEETEIKKTVRKPKTELEKTEILVKKQIKIVNTAKKKRDKAKKAQSDYHDKYSKNPLPPKLYEKVKKTHKELGVEITKAKKKYSEVYNKFSALYQKYHKLGGKIDYRKQLD